jgi:hypothetical protein
VASQPAAMAVEVARIHSERGHPTRLDGVVAEHRHVTIMS